MILGGDSARERAPEYGGDRSVSAELLERVTYGAYLAQRTGLPVLVTGSAAETLGDARHAWHVTSVSTTRWVETRVARYLPECAVLRALLRADGVTRIILVTERDHEWRAVQEFASAGLDVVPAPRADLWAPHGSGVRLVPAERAGAAALHAGTLRAAREFVRRAVARTHLRRQSALEQAGTARGRHERRTLTGHGVSLASPQRAAMSGCWC